MNKIQFISLNNINLTILTKMCEHLGVSILTGKRAKRYKGSAIRKHQLFGYYLSGFDNFSSYFGVLHWQQWQSPTSAPVNYFKFNLIDSFLINRDHFPWNKKRQPLPLELFDDWETYFYHMIAVYWSGWGCFILHRYCFVKWTLFYSCVITL